MSNEKAQINRTLTLQLFAIMLLLMFLTAILLTEVVRTRVATDCSPAKVSSIEQSFAGVGYFAREESPVKLKYNLGGAVKYLAEDGQTVEPGDPLATVYPNAHLTDNDRATAAALMEEKNFLLQAESADVSAGDPAYSYTAVMEHLSKGNMAGAEAAGENLSFSLAVLKRGESAARLTEIEEELSQLLFYEESVENCAAFGAGVYCRQNDGLEERLTAAAAKSLTPGALNALLKAPADTEDTAGHITGSASCFLLLLPTDYAKLFTVGESYALHFTADDFTAQLSLLAVNTDESGSLLCFDAAGLAPTLSRRQNVTVTLAQYTGIFLPAAALYEEGEELYVFVRENGVAVKRKVKPLYRDDGRCLSAQNEEGYLQEGEEIVLIGRRLFEGKEIP